MGEWRTCRGLRTTDGSIAKERTRYHTLEAPVFAMALGPSLPVAQSSLRKVLSHSSLCSHALNTVPKPQPRDRVALIQASQDCSELQPHPGGKETGSESA